MGKTAQVTFSAKQVLLGYVLGVVTALALLLGLYIGFHHGIGVGIAIVGSAGPQPEIFNIFEEGEKPP